MNAVARPCSMRCAADKKRPCACWCDAAPTCMRSTKKAKPVRCGFATCASGFTASLGSHRRQHHIVASLADAIVARARRRQTKRGCATLSQGSSAIQRKSHQSQSLLVSWLCWLIDQRQGIEWAISEKVIENTPESIASFLHIADDLNMVRATATLRPFSPLSFFAGEKRRVHRGQGRSGQGRATAVHEQTGLCQHVRGRSAARSTHTLSIAGRSEQQTHQKNWCLNTCCPGSTN